MLCALLSLSQPGLITGLSKFNKRVYYEIIEYDPILDSSDMNMGDWCKIAKDIAVSDAHACLRPTRCSVCLTATRTSPTSPTVMTLLVGRASST